MIIGVLGFINSGKGTVGDILESNFLFEKESFAKPVKDAVSAIFGWDRSQLEGDTKESRLWRELEDSFWKERIPGMSPRKALQLMGTEAGRNIFHPDLWLYSLEKRLNPHVNYVVTDVRFPNEMEFIKKLGGTLIRVKRGENPNWYHTAVNTNMYYKGVQTMPDYPDIHYSEWASVGYPVHYTIENDSTLENLYENVRVIINKLTI